MCSKLDTEAAAITAVTKTFSFASRRRRRKCFWLSRHSRYQILCAAVKRNTLLVEFCRIIITLTVYELSLCITERLGFAGGHQRLEMWAAPSQPHWQRSAPYDCTLHRFQLLTISTSVAAFSLKDDICVYLIIYLLT